MDHETYVKILMFAPFAIGAGFGFCLGAMVERVRQEKGRR